MPKKTLKTLTAAVVAGGAVAVFAIAQDGTATTRPAAGTAELTATTAPAPTTQEALTRVSYDMGFRMAQQFKSAGLNLDVGTLNDGIKDALAGTPSRVTQEQAEEGISVISSMVSERDTAKQRDYLTANKAKAGVRTTASGLQIETVTEGTGPNPKASDTVKVHYTGTLVDGTKFDSSVDRGEPATFPLDAVIPGWTEGLQLVKVGGKAKLTIPGELGYGPRGSPDGRIPPNATLLFDVELLEIVPPATQPATQPAGGMNPATPTQQP